MFKRSNEHWHSEGISVKMYNESGLHNVATKHSTEL